MKVFDFQNTAIDNLTVTFKRLLESTSQPNEFSIEKTPEILLKAPTGSGKTYMATHFINNIAHQNDLACDVCYLWVTLNNNLALQSKEKFEEYFAGNLLNTLYTVNDLDGLEGNHLHKNDILFFNWQIVAQNKSQEKLLLRRPQDERKHKEQGCYFDDIIENTVDAGVSIILVIDESHAYTDAPVSTQLVEFINPRLIFKISATPFKNEMAKKDFFCKKGMGLADLTEVKEDDVVAAGLIKKEIFSQTREDLKRYMSQKISLDKALINLAVEKRKEIKSEWESIGLDINPLVLIQLPNDEKKEGSKKASKLNFVDSYLKELGIDESKIAHWLSADHKGLDIEDISRDNSSVNFLIFKTAAAVGWDCRRAHIIVMFRDIKSHSFEIQTLGRIRRMASMDKSVSGHPMLSIGYLYTDHERHDIEEIPVGTDNKPKINHSYLRDDQKLIMAAKKLSLDIQENLTKSGLSQKKVTKACINLAKQFDDKFRNLQSEDGQFFARDFGGSEEKKFVKDIRRCISNVLKTVSVDSSKYDFNRTIEVVVSSLKNKDFDVEFVIDPFMVTEFASRIDYGDFVSKIKFQKSFIASMNKFFGIKDENSKNLGKLVKKGIEWPVILTKKVVSNIRIVSISNIKNKDNKLGENLNYSFSNEEIEDLFKQCCIWILKAQTEESLKIDNIARTWGDLKSALLVWFNQYIESKTFCLNDWYKMFIGDISKNDSSIFAVAIATALRDYAPMRANLLQERKSRKLSTTIYRVKNRYDYNEDYVEFLPSALSLVQPFRIPDKYHGRKNEVEFIQFLESNADGIKWWFKQGEGKDYFGLQYEKKSNHKEAMFYPDWIIKFSDGRIGIFDTKGGTTAENEDGRACALATKLKKMNDDAKNNLFIGGLVVKSDNSWYYNDKAKYKYKNDNGTLANEWKPLISLFKKNSGE